MPWRTFSFAKLFTTSWTTGLEGSPSMKSAFSTRALCAADLSVAPPPTITLTLQLTLYLALFAELFPSTFKSFNFQLSPFLSSRIRFFPPRLRTGGSMQLIHFATQIPCAVKRIFVALLLLIAGFILPVHCLAQGPQPI